MEMGFLRYQNEARMSWGIMYPTSQAPEEVERIMRIFGLGLPELLIILAIVCILFGPALFKKLNKQVKETGEAAKKGIENGAKAAGTNVDLDHIDKNAVLDKVESFQDRVDKMFEDDEEKQPAKDDQAAKEPEAKA